ncbi:MAG: tripartite tricarboxylate transporter substrate binding protein [Betaproteobacteria bacterium]|nr:tripartite tricarboxylate transporter substrate binding protein [Betaproteobacteria bacterium]
MKLCRKPLHTLGVMAVALGAVAAAPAHAQQYPTRAVTVLVGFAPGGGGDILTRAYAAELGKALGQTFVVENRAGANGMLAAGALAKAAPDGYSLGMSVPALLTNAMLVPTVPYKLADFQPVGMMAATPMVLVVNPGVQAKSVKEFVALAKAQPGKINYAGAGAASTAQLFMELFNFKTGISTAHIPYKGGAPGMASTVAGETAITWVSTAQGLPLIGAGKLRALAVSTGKRVPSLPDVPTLRESGVPGFVLDVWFGYWAPAATPRPIVDRLNTEMNRIAKSPEMQGRLEKLGVLPLTGSPEDAAAIQKAEIDQWTELFKHVKISAE